MSRKMKIKVKLLQHDIQRHTNIQNKINSGKDCFREIASFIRHIEQDYDLDRVPLTDFVFDGPGSSEFFMDDSKHAVKIYLDLCLKIVDKFGDKDVEEFYQQLVTYCRRLMKRIKEAKFEDEYGYDHMSNFVMFLLYIISAAKAKNNILDFIRAYKELITFFDKHRPIPFFPWFDDEYTEKDHFKKLEKLLETAKFLKESGIQIFGNDPKLINTFISALNFATDDEPCLILGETGTGKEIVAKVIHAFSKRKNNKFFGINVAGFTPSLFDSDIQGILGGYATGVVSHLGAFLTTCSTKGTSGKDVGYYIKGNTIGFRDKDGNIKNSPTREQLMAVGGTLFLDEINSLELSLQPKLLRIIQEREVQVIGDKHPKKFHLKLLCASNSDLKKDIQRGTFRADLYYRIHRGIIELPPLRKMKSSMFDIANFYVEKLSKSLGIDKKISLSESAVKKLKTHSWPGNHRELENVLYQAMKRMILDNKFTIKTAYIEKLENVPTEQRQFDFTGIKYDELAEKYFRFIFKEAHGNQQRATYRAGLTRMKMRTRLKKYGII